MKKRVLVTGASKGIGRGIALELAKVGFEIAVHYFNDESGASTTLDEIQKLGGTGHTLRFDVSDREQSLAVIDEDLSKHGAFYGLVSNAGITRDTAFPAMSGEEWDQVIHTNLDSFYNVIQPCVMPMVRAKNGGRIITMSSVSGLVGNRGQVNYSASKAGLIGATKALAIELGKRNITVNCVAPGLIDTGILSREVIEHSKEMIPLRRIGNVDEVSGLVGFLMSERGSYITRQVISVNGGMV